MNFQRFGDNHVTTFNRKVIECGRAAFINTFCDGAVYRVGVKYVVFCVNRNPHKAKSSADFEAVYRINIRFFPAAGVSACRCPGVIIIVIIPGKSGNTDRSLGFTFEITLGKLQMAKGVKIYTTAK